MPEHVWICSECGDIYFFYDVTTRYYVDLFGETEDEETINETSLKCFHCGATPTSISISSQTLDIILDLYDEERLKLLELGEEEFLKRRDPNNKEYWISEEE